MYKHFQHPKTVSNLFPPQPRWWVIGFNCLPVLLLLLPSLSSSSSSLLDYTHPTTHSHVHTTHYTKPDTQNRLHTTDDTQPTTHTRLNRTDCTEPTTQNRQHRTDSTEPTTDNRCRCSHSGPNGSHYGGNLSTDWSAIFIFPRP